MRTALLPRVLRPRNAVALTVSDNEIADTFGVTRLAGLQGDGRAFPDRSTGIWRTATNLFKWSSLNTANATSEPSGTYVTPGGGPANVLARAVGTTAPLLFGSGYGRWTMTTFNSGTANIDFEDAADPTGFGSDNIAAAATDVLTFSLWARYRTTQPTAGLLLVIRPMDATHTQIGSVTTVSMDSITTTFQRFSVTATMPALTAFVRLYIEWAGPTGSIIEVDGAQLEANVHATPVILTSAATAARAAARVRHAVATDFITSAQGWAAFRVRAGFASTQAVGNCYLFTVRTDASNHISLLWDQAGGNVWSARRQSAGVGTAADAGDTLALADLVTIVMYWTASTIAISVDGGAFTTAANAVAPDLAALTLDIGSNGGSEQANMDFLWSAFGNGTITASEARRLHDIGAAGGVPDPYDLPGPSVTVWDGRNAVAERRAS